MVYGKHTALSIMLMILTALPAAAQVEQIQRFVASPGSIVIDESGVVQRWQNLVAGRSSMDLVRIQGHPIFVNGGVELGQRSDGSDYMISGGTIGSANKAVLIVLTASLYTKSDRYLATGSNVMSLLRMPGNNLGIQTNNGCLIQTPDNLGLRQVYALRRTPGPGGTELSLFRYNQPTVTQFQTCATLDVVELAIGNGSISPPDPDKGLLVFELETYAAPVNLAPGVFSSALDDAFVEEVMQRHAEDWGLEPTPVVPTTWGRIKLLAK
jgi:hypothetical protein